MNGIGRSRTTKPRKLSNREQFRIFLIQYYERTLKKPRNRGLKSGSTYEAANLAITTLNGFLEGRANTSSPAVREACKHFKIPLHPRNIREFLLS